jgi:hypothetical protein
MAKKQQLIIKETSQSPAALRELLGPPPILPSESPDERGSLAPCATWPYRLALADRAHDPADHG